jgi:hypothetical protein
MMGTKKLKKPETTADEMREALAHDWMKGSELELQQG